MHAGGLSKLGLLLHSNLLNKRQFYGNQRKTKVNDCNRL